MEFSKENLINLLEFCVQSVRDDKMDETTQERIWNSLTWDKNDAENADIIKYLFAGWCIYQQLKDHPTTLQ